MKPSARNPLRTKILNQRRELRRLNALIRHSDLGQSAGHEARKALAKCRQLRHLLAERLVRSGECADTCAAHGWITEHVDATWHGRDQ